MTRKKVVAALLFLAVGLSAAEWWDLRRFRLGMTPEEVGRVAGVRLDLEKRGAFEVARFDFAPGPFVVSASVEFSGGRLERVSYLVKGDASGIYRAALKKYGYARNVASQWFDVCGFWSFGGAVYVIGYTGDMARVNVGREFFLK